MKSLVESKVIRRFDFRYKYDYRYALRFVAILYGRRREIFVPILVYNYGFKNV